MQMSEWFSMQLKASGDAFVWAIEQIPEGRYELTPPVWQLGEWPMARHLFHLVLYEKEAVLPHLHHWLGAPLDIEAIRIQLHGQDEVWKNHQSVQTMLAEFQQVRAQQIQLLQQIPEPLWHEIWPAYWGPVSLKWIMTKTYQHSAEHTHNVLCLSLFWDIFLARQGD